MPAEHWRPTGLSQGYYCGRCGNPVSMYNPSHDLMCEPNSELVKRLNELNTVEAQKKREFLDELKRGK